MLTKVATDLGLVKFWVVKQVLRQIVSLVLAHLRLTLALTALLHQDLLEALPRLDAVLPVHLPQAFDVGILPVLDDHGQVFCLRKLLRLLRATLLVELLVLLQFLLFLLVF